MIEMWQSYFFINILTNFKFFRIFSSSDILLHDYHLSQKFSKTDSPHKKTHPQNSIFVIFAMFTSLPIFFEHALSWSLWKSSIFLFLSDSGLSQNNILSKVKNSSSKPLSNCTFFSSETLHTFSNKSESFESQQRTKVELSTDVHWNKKQDVCKKYSNLAVRFSCQI